MEKIYKILIGVWISVIALGGIYFFQKANSKKVHDVKVTIEKNKEENTTIIQKIYVPNKELKGLVAKEVEISSTFNVQKKAFEIASKVLEDLNERALLSKSVNVKDVFLKDGVIYLNCDSGMDSLKKDDKKNILLVYSLVNSLADIKDVDGIKILINGQETSGIFAKTLIKNTKL